MEMNEVENRKTTEKNQENQKLVFIKTNNNDKSEEF
jgi:hypothetical protein